MKNVLEAHMGDSFDKLSPLLRKAHKGNKLLHGHAEVKRGNLLAEIVCTLFRFPMPAKQACLRVECSHTENTMQWDRSFDDLKMSSHFTRQGHYLVEHLGLLDLEFIANERNGKLHYDFIKTRFLKIPLPNFLSPQVIAYEQETEGKYCFKVEVNMFLIGLIITYYGTLDVEDIRA